MLSNTTKPAPPPSKMAPRMLTPTEIASLEKEAAEDGKWFKAQLAKQAK